MEKTSSQKIQLGIFVVVGLILFVLAIYYIGSRRKIFEKTSELVSVFRNVNGLQPGNNVRYAGINAGAVDKIEMINDTTIRVEMLIDQEIFMHIRKDAIAAIGSDGLVGNMIINLIPGQGKEAPVEPGDEIQSYSRISTDEILNTLNVTNENAAILTSDLLKITNEFIQGKGTVGRLINDTLLAGSIERIMHYIELTSKGTAESVQGLNALVNSLSSGDNVIGVLNDKETAEQLRSTVEGLEGASQQMQVVLQNLEAATLNIKEGDGAINYLSNDPELVVKINSVMCNLDTTMVNLNEASVLLNQNLEALKHSSLTKGYFKKLEKEEKKKK
jgi:phospholipid/cholesterol/gamma-HCH transport system substrate-binding protein